MGNVSSLARASSALDSYVAELGTDISYEKSLSSSRFLKTILVRHAYGLLVVKLFIKPDTEIQLRVFQRRLKHQRDVLQDLPSVLPYATFVDTEKAGYLIRQYAGSNLYDRISTRPYLSYIEKKWITYQLLAAMRDAKAREIAHGDLKSENVLITPALTVLITDFASAFKPTFLPLNDPSDFSYFYDSAGRRTCYLAPERFYAEDSKIAEEKRLATTNVSVEAVGSWINSGVGKRDGKVTEKMDVFSVGCVLLEMWTDGATFFTLSELYAYREGKSGDVEMLLGSLPDVPVRSMIASMLALNPDNRPTFEKALSDCRNTVFPDYFYTFLGDYVVNLAADHHVPSHITTNDPIAKSLGQADAIILGVCRDWPGIISAMMEEHNLSQESKRQEAEADGDGFDKQIDVRDDQDGPALLLLNILTANIRNCIRESSKVKAMDPLKELSRLLTADEVIDRILPYLVSLFRDDAAQVRSSALKLLVQILHDLEIISAHNAGIITEYIMPNVRNLAEDDDILVRTTFAQLLPDLSDIGMNILEMGQALKAVEMSGMQMELDPGLEPGYDAAVNELIDIFAEQASSTMLDSASDVKRAALTNIAQMCLVFGRSKTNEVLLSRMITYLNDKDWRLRSAFLENIVSVAAFVGTTSLEEFVLPLMEQALADPEDFVVARALVSLASLTEIQLFSKARMLELLSSCCGFLCHPSVWIRQGAASFIAVICRRLSDADVWCLVYPYVRPLLQADVEDLSPGKILAVISAPLPRPILDYGKTWASRSLRGPWWSAAHIPGRGSKYVKAFKMRLPPTADSSQDLDEKETAHLKNLQAKGLRNEDWVKFVSLRDYMATQAATAVERGVAEDANSSSHNSFVGSNVALQSLDVTPLTIFITPRTSPSDKPPSGIDKLKSPTSRFLADESRRPSFSSKPLPLRQRMHSQDTAVSDADNLSELQRRLKSLDAINRDLNMTPTLPTSDVGESPAHVAPSTVTSTLQDRSQGGVRLARSRTSFGKESIKAAPAISASTDHAVGKLESAAVLQLADVAQSVSSGGNTPKISLRKQHNPPPDLSQPFTSTYEGQDPNILGLLNRSYYENPTINLEHLGPITSRGPPAKRPSPHRSKSGLKGGDQGVTLIANFTTHSKVILDLLVSIDQSYFLSVDADGLIALWDLSRLEKSVSNKPRLMYELDTGAVTAMCGFAGRATYAFATSQGIIHIVRVYSTGSKLVKIGAVQQMVFDLDSGNIVHLHSMKTEDETRLLWVTELGKISVADMRTGSVALSFQQTPTLGRVTASFVDVKLTWIVTGTSDGHLCLWDLRYGLLVRQWKAGDTSIVKIAGHPTKGAGKWILVSQQAETGSSESCMLTAIDVSTGSVVERFEVHGAGSKAEDRGKALKIREDAAAPSEVIASLLQGGDIRLDETQTLRGRDSTDVQDYRHVTAIHSLAGTGNRSAPDLALSPVQESGLEAQQEDEAETPGAGGIIITAGEDKIIRLWNLGRSADGMVVSASGKDMNKRYKNSKLEDGTIVHSELPPRQPETRQNMSSRAVRKLAEEQPRSSSTINGMGYAHSIAKPHLDGITALTTFETPYSPAMMIASGDRSGVIKVWRIDT